MHSSCFWDRETACTIVKMVTLRATMVWRERDLVSLASRLGSYAGIVKWFVGVGGGATSPLIFFGICVTLKNSKVSSQTLAIAANVCQSKTSLSWPFGLAVHSRGDRARLSEPRCVP